MNEAGGARHIVFSCEVTVTESELYRELGALTKDKARWEAGIPRVALLLTCESTKIRAKALWLLGEMGLKYSGRIGD